MDYNFHFQDPYLNHINYYRFIKAVPNEILDKLQKVLDTKDLIDATINRKNNTSNIENSNDSYSNVIDQKYRSTKVYWIPKTDEFIDIYKMFMEYVKKCNDDFFKFRLTGIIEPIQYSVYTAEDNGHYDWHIDMVTESHRKLSIVCHLTEPTEYEGGELQINLGGEGKLTIPEKEKGTIVIFPSYMLHRVTPVTKGTRRTLVLWVDGPALV